MFFILFSFKLVHFLLFSLKKKKQKQDIEKGLSDPLCVMSVHATGQGCPVKETPDGTLFKTVNGPLCNGAQQIPSLPWALHISPPSLSHAPPGRSGPAPRPLHLCPLALSLLPPILLLSGPVTPSASSGHPSLPPSPASSEGRTLVLQELGA